MGLYTIVLVLAEVVLVGASVARGQRYALWVLGVGVAVIALWLATVLLKIAFPYDRLGLNIYLTLIIGIMCILAGLIGICIRLIRRFL
jgi:hypothetical protein